MKCFSIEEAEKMSWKEDFQRAEENFRKKWGTRLGVEGIVSRVFEQILLKSISESFSVCSRGVPCRPIAETGRFYPQSTHQRNPASPLPARQREQSARPDAEKPGIQPVTQAGAVKLSPTLRLCMSDFRKHLSRREDLRVILWLFRVIQICIEDSI